MHANNATSSEYAHPFTLTHIFNVKGRFSSRPLSEADINGGDLG